MPEPIETRLARYRKINPETGCHEWSGGLNHGGYGRMNIAYRTKQVHRVAYELEVGPIPDGLQLDHLCRNRKCFNVAHLEPVTPRENTMRGQTVTRANAEKTHCHNGHAFSGANTLKSGHSRYCRECCRQKCRDYYARNRVRRNAQIKAQKASRLSAE